MAIRSFGDQLAEDLFDDRRTNVVRAFPPELHRTARRKLLYLHEADELGDLRAPEVERPPTIWRAHESRKRAA